jgi:hypothetical protein
VCYFHLAISIYFLYWFSDRFSDRADYIVSTSDVFVSMNQFNSRTILFDTGQDNTSDSDNEKSLLFSGPRFRSPVATFHRAFSTIKDYMKIDATPSIKARHMSVCGL